MISLSGPNRHVCRIAQLLLLTIFSATPVAIQAQNKIASPDYSPIISDLRGSIPKLMSEQKVPGMAVVVVDAKGILWLEGFGYTDNDRKNAVTPETLFSAQSMSKNFTAAAVLVAVQDGLLDLDTPIKNYLPGFTVNSRFDAHPEEKITLRLLLSHRAGFTHEAPVGNNFGGDATSFEEHIKSIPQTRLRFPVGQRYSYSNLGVDVAGYILQVRSGMPFPQYVKQKLLDPIGMKASSFEMQYIKSAKERAMGHTAFPQEPVVVPMLAAGGLYTNALELGRYIQFHLNRGKVDGKSILKEELLRQMYDIPSPFPGQVSGYGLGIGIERVHETICLNHGGGGFGFLSKMIWYPEFGLGIAMLTNSSEHSFQNSLPHEILDRFITAKLGHASAEAPKLSNTTQNSYGMRPARERMLEGQYLYTGGGYEILVYKQNRLGTDVGKDFVPMVWTSEDEGFFPLEGMHLLYRFFRNPDGTPAYVVHMNDGEFLNFNTGPSDGPGPNKAEWDTYLGKYDMKMHGYSAGTVEIRKQNGEMFLDYMKLEEFQPGLFFTSHGEALDFRGPTPTWKNLRLQSQSTSTPD